VPLKRRAAKCWPATREGEFADHHLDGHDRCTCLLFASVATEFLNTIAVGSSRTHARLYARTDTDTQIQIQTDTHTHTHTHTHMRAHMHGMHVVFSWIKACLCVYGASNDERGND
jgi:hypothetical protein